MCESIVRELVMDRDTLLYLNWVPTSAYRIAHGSLLNVMGQCGRQGSFPKENYKRKKSRVNYILCCCQMASLVTQIVKNLPEMQKNQVQSLGQENPLEKGTATHSSILAWWIPWPVEPGGLLTHTDTHTLRHTHTHIYCCWSIQFSSVTESCPTLCDPMDHSMPGLPVHHQLPEFTQTHVHWVGDAIQLSHPLLPPSPPAFNLSQHQGLFQRVSSSHQVAKVLEFQLQQQFFQWIFRTDFL